MQNSIWQRHNQAQLPTPFKVILAEDNDDFRQLISDTLRYDGYEVIEARNGKELLNLITDQLLFPKASETADLVISDVLMPGENGMITEEGLHALTAVRELDWATPFIMITACTDDQVRNAAEELGAYLLKKPFRLADLRTAVFNLAGFRHERPAPH